MTWNNDGPNRWVIQGHSYSNSPWIQEAEYGYTVQGKQTPVKGYKGLTIASFNRAKKYAEKQLSRYKVANPSTKKYGYSIYYRRNYVDSVSAKTKAQAISIARREFGDRLGEDPKQITAEKHTKMSGYNQNPGVPKGKFIPCKAVKINSNGSVSVRL